MPIIAATTYLFCVATLYHGAQFFGARAPGRTKDKHVVAVVLVLTTLYLIHSALAVAVAPDRVAGMFHSVAGAAQLTASAASAIGCWRVAQHRRGRDARIHARQFLGRRG